MRFGMIAALMAIAFTATALADDAHHAKPAGATAQASGAMADAEVRRVDKAGGRLTLRHGPIKSLDMPAMTMVFRVKDPAMFDTVKEGDRIRFEAVQTGGQYTVTRIEPAK